MRCCGWRRRQTETWRNKYSTLLLTYGRAAYPLNSIGFPNLATALSIRKSLIYSYLDRYASLAVNIVSSMVIARMLTPADIGVFSVTMVLISFVATVRDLGAGQYLIQEKELTTDRIRAVWAVQLGLGVFLGLLVLASSVPVASFYKEPRMRDIMLVVAANYMVNPFGSLTYAWQMREMRFDALALVRFTSTLVGALVSIYTAWLGYGPISLAFGAMGTTLVNAGMAVFFRPKNFPWLPGLKEVRRVLAFGSQLTGSSVLQTVGYSTPELVLGKLQGMTATGLYSRSNGLVSMFSRLVLEGMNVVAISWFAKQSRENESIAPTFLRATSYVTALGWAFTAGVVFLAHPTIRIMYGDQWDGAVDLTRLIALSMAFSLPCALCQPALMALGSVKRMLRINAITTVFTIVLTGIGAYFGLMPMAFFGMLAMIVRSWVWLVNTRQEVQFSWAELASRMLNSAAVAAAAGLGPLCAFLVYGAYPASSWPVLAMGVPSSFAGFLLGLMLFKHPLLEELQPLWAKIRKSA